MKHTIKNLTNGPHQLRGVDGPVIVGALDSVTDEFDPLWLAMARQVRYFEIAESNEKRDPLDHDGDGKRGGFVQESESEEPAKRRGRPPKAK